MKDYKKIYEEWLSNPYFDEETKAELTVTLLSPFLSNRTENISHTGTNQKQAEAVILVADEENFRTQGKQRCCVITENSTHREDRITTNTHVSHI